MISKMFSDFARKIKIGRAEKAINPEVFNIVQVIHERYANLNVSGLDWPSDESQKLSRLIQRINEDENLKYIHYGDQFTFNHELRTGEKTGCGGFGVNLYFDYCRNFTNRRGLTVYDWNDYESKYNEMPANPETIAQFNPAFTAEKLRTALVSATERNNFIKWYSDFKLN